MDITQTPVDLATAGLEAFNTKDSEAYRALLHRDIVYKEVAYNLVLYGTIEVLDRISEYWTAYPDIHGEILSVLPGEEVCGLELVWRGTNTGRLVTPVASFPPTGNTLITPSFLLVGIKDDKIISYTHYFDVFSTLTQLELIPKGFPVPV